MLMPRIIKKCPLCREEMPEPLVRALDVERLVDALAGQISCPHRPCHYRSTYMAVLAHREACKGNSERSDFDDGFLCPAYSHR